MAEENVTTKFKVDISDLKKGITQANGQLKTLRAELKNANAGMEKGEETVDSLTKKIKTQTEIVETEKKKLDLLKQELDKYRDAAAKGQQVVDDLTKKHEEAAKAFGEDSKEAQELAAQLAKAQAAQEKNETAVQNLTTKVIEQDTAYKNAQGQVKSFQGQLDNLEGEEKEAKGATDDATQATKDYDQAMADGAKTGGGLDALSVALGTFVANAAAKVIGAFKDIAEYAAKAYSEFDNGADAVYRATGATGEAAEELKDSYAKVAKSVRGDTETIGKTLGEVSTRFGLTGDELEATTEQFLRFADVTGTDAVTSVQSVSKMMEAAGMDASEYADILDQLTVAGQVSGISVDTLLTNLQSSGAVMRSVGYDTEETIAMFAQWEKAGVNAASTAKGFRYAFQNWSKEGKNFRTELNKVSAQIANAADEEEAMAIATEAFGGKAGAEFVDAIRSGRLEYGDMLAVIKDSEGAVTNTYDQTESAIDKVNLKIQALKITVAEMVDRLLVEYGPEIEELLGKIDEWLQSIDKEDIDSIITGLERLINLVKFFGGGLSTTSEKWGTFENGGKSAIQTLGSTLKDFYLYMVDEAVPDMIDTWKTGWEDIEQKGSDALAWMEMHGGNFLDSWSVGWHSILDWIDDKLEKIAGWIDGIVSKANGLKSSVSELTSGIGSTASNAFAALGIPRFAEGGIVTSSTIANIGEAGTEAVIPLSRNKAGMKRIAELLADEMRLSRPGAPGAAGKGGGGTVYNFTQNNTSPKALSRWEIYRQTRNLLNTVRGG